jgi:hypothetical protein
MTGIDKVKIGVNKLKASLGALVTIAFGIVPFYFVDLDNLTSQDIVFPPITIFMLYISYRYFIRRLLLGPIITLTKESMTVKDEDRVNIYRWTNLKKVKVGVVTEKNIEGRNVSHTILTVWTTTNDKSDEFHVSDLENSSDEIRDLINGYIQRYSR